MGDPWILSNLSSKWNIREWLEDIRVNVIPFIKQKN
jgi:hypothetical protein